MEDRRDPAAEAAFLEGRRLRDAADARRDRSARRRVTARRAEDAASQVLIAVVAVMTMVLVAALVSFWLRVAVGAAPTLLPVLAIVAGLVVRDRVRRRVAGGPAARPPALPAADAAWTLAQSRFAAVRDEYAAFECDPLEVLRSPALTDVRVPSTGRFVDAFAEAQALHTDAFPGESPAASYVTAVERAERAWRAARDAAERIRLGDLTPEERGSVERVVKLLTTARNSDSQPERLVAYERARTELEKLDRAGVIHMSRTARAVLEVAGRGQLPA